MVWHQDTSEPSRRTRLIVFPIAQVAVCGMLDAKNRRANSTISSLGTSFNGGACKRVSIRDNTIHNAINQNSIIDLASGANAVQVVKLFEGFTRLMQSDNFD